MRSSSEKARAIGLVNEAFARVVYPACNGKRRTAGARWEDGLTDFEWIEFWASLYCGEVADSKSSITIKQ